jgi:hypothetical protein
MFSKLRSNLNLSTKHPLHALLRASVHLRNGVGGFKRKAEPASIILPKYNNFNSKARKKTEHRATIIGLFIIVNLFIGACYDFFNYVNPTLLAPFIIFIAIPYLCCVFFLPENRNPPVQLLTKTLYAAVFAYMAWPSYLAIALPGLPWINVQRLTLGPLLVLVVYCLATSGEIRGHVWRTLNSIPSFRPLFITYVVMITLSCFTSVDAAESFKRLLAFYFQVLTIFFSTIIVLRDPKKQATLVNVFLAGALVVSSIALWEGAVQHVLWVGHIPSFLKIDSLSVVELLKGQTRDGVYRSTSTTSNPMLLGELMAMTFPFALHFVFNPVSRTQFIASLALGVLILQSALASGARSGFLGCLITLLVYVGVFALKQQGANKMNLFKPVLVLSVPTIFVMFAFSVVFVGRVNQIFMGKTDATNESTQSRVEQWTMGWPKILARPWGHGYFTSGSVLGYAPYGFTTIDSQYLSWLLDIGIVGFIVAVLMIVVSILKTFSTYLRFAKRNDLSNYLLPVACGLLNFFYIKSVLSEMANEPYFYMFLGMGLSLCYDHQRSTSTTGSAQPVVAATSRRFQVAPVFASRDLAGKRSAARSPGK